MQKLKTSIIISLLLCSFISFFSIPVNANTETKTTMFRPFYKGYAQGTIVIIAVDENTSIINREWNLEGWNLTQTWDYDKGKWVSSLAMHIVYCEPNWIFWPASSGIYYAPPVRVYISTDNGETFPIYRDFGRKTLVMDKKWSPYNQTTNWLYAIASYYFEIEDLSLFAPTTRIKILFPQSYPLEPPIYLGNYYWGSTQQPVPPYDWIDDYSDPPNWAYVQYAIWFTVEYTENTIEYEGSTIDFPYDFTKLRFQSLANMIINTMHPSGLSNEVVTTDIPFGTNTWVVIYSSQLAMMEMIDLMQIFPEENYLLPVKRFITWMWNKQNLTDGSFPFILTGGDQHCWYDATTSRWYGYDKIDSFSACAISLMVKYYNATEDIAFLNSYWSQIVKCKDFMWDLLNTTSWIPVDGYHYNGTYYNKSTWTWTHDAVECWQGFKDYAYLCDVKGLTEDRDYFNNVADSVKNAINTLLWNETLKRYVGMYDVVNGIQDLTKVYNVITPIIYGVCDNVTKAQYTVSDYVDWGILSGRYYDKDWAEDYNVYNEYSTMSGMIYSAYARLIMDFNYSETWMKDSFLEVSKFLFVNPIYPYKDLQNKDGFLDYVNLVNYTYAWEYARLIEAGAWIIDGFMKLSNMTELFTYTPTELLIMNETLKQQSLFWNETFQLFKEECYKEPWNSQTTYNEWVKWLKNKGLYVQWYDYIFSNYLFEHDYLEDEPWWEDLWDEEDIDDFMDEDWWDWWWEWWQDWWKKFWEDEFRDIWREDYWWYPYIEIPNYVPLFCGLFGLVLLVGTPYYVIKKMKEGEYADGVGWGIIMFVLGIGFIIVWLW